MKEVRIADNGQQVLADITSNLNHSVRSTIARIWDKIPQKHRGMSKIEGKGKPVRTVTLEGAAAYVFLSGKPEDITYGVEFLEQATKAIKERNELLAEKLENKRLEAAEEKKKRQEADKLADGLSTRNKYLKEDRSAEYELMAHELSECLGDQKRLMKAWIESTPEELYDYVGRFFKFIQ